MKLKIRRIGNSLGVVLPREVVTRLNAGDGKDLYLSEIAGEGYRLSSYDQDFADKINMAEDLMDRYKNALHVLAE